MIKQLLAFWIVVVTLCGFTYALGRQHGRQGGRESARADLDLKYEQGKLDGLNYNFDKIEGLGDRYADICEAYQKKLNHLTALLAARDADDAAMVETFSRLIKLYGPTYEALPMPRLVEAEFVPSLGVDEHH